MSAPEKSVDCAAVEPRWAHPDGAVAYSGIGRTQIYSLIKSGAIRSIRISKNDSVRGRAQRLIDLRSIDRWIESHGDEGGKQ